LEGNKRGCTFGKRKEITAGDNNAGELVG
jgi:hypothetical protein